MGLCASSGVDRPGANQKGGGGEEKKTNVVAAEMMVKAAMHVKRRVDIFSAGFDPTTQFQAPIFEKSKKSRDMLDQCLQSHFLFSSLTNEDREMVITAFEPENFAAGKEIITQGDENGDFFYILDKGKCHCLKDKGKGKGDEKVKNYTSGDGFGELGILYTAPRAASIIADTAGSLFKLDKETFRHGLARSEYENNNVAKDSLTKVKMLERLGPDELAALADAVSLSRFPAGQLIIKKGSAGDIFYLILEGTVEMTEIDGLDKPVTASADSDTAYFGELALIKNAPRACNVTAKTDCKCLALNRADFLKMLGPLEDVMNANFCFGVFKTLELFKGVPEEVIKTAAQQCKIEDFEPGVEIITQGEKGDKFYVMSEGEAAVIKDGTQVSGLDAGKHFGEQALLEDPNRNATIKAISRVRCFTIDKSTFEEVKKNASNFNKMLSSESAAREEKENEFKESLKMREDIKFADLKFLQKKDQDVVLGTGTFGRVKLVHLPRSDETFALKIMQKKQVVEYRQQQNVMHEKNVMVEARHPFILQLICTFQDKNLLYMLMELCLGGELFSLLHGHGGASGGDCGGLSPAHAAFYSACTLDGLAYLHSRKICYRDLKPENLLIDDLGYIKVVDFGFAKVIETKSYTLCGTPEYLAPEIVLAKGHNKGVDYWAFGVLIYEMRHSFSPFAQNCDVNNHVAICKNIVKNQLVFPDGCKGNLDSQLIKGLLTTQPHMRLGCMANGAGDIKAHAFYKGLSWNKLLQKEIKAPWIPKLKSKKDVTFFDPPEDAEIIDPYNNDDPSGWEKDFAPFTKASGRGSG